MGSGGGRKGMAIFRYRETIRNLRFQWHGRRRAWAEIIHKLQSSLFIGAPEGGRRRGISGGVFHQQAAAAAGRFMQFPSLERTGSRTPSPFSAVKYRGETAAFSPTVKA